MKKTSSKNGHRVVKKADIPDIKSLDELSPLGQELFQLMEQIPAEQRLTQRQIEKEIARRRGAPE
jgi:hypothetical protein